MVRMVVLLALIAPVAFAAPTLRWESVTTDINENTFDASIGIKYAIYRRPQGGTEPGVLFGETEELEMDTAGAPLGCYEYYATAFRLDIEPPLESDQSNGVVICDVDFSKPKPPANLRVDLSLP
jgi:hypothetical protein